MEFLKFLLKLSLYHYVLKQMYCVQASGNSSWFSVLGCGSENGFYGEKIFQIQNDSYLVAGGVDNYYNGYWFQNYSQSYLLLTQYSNSGKAFNTKLSASQGIGYLSGIAMGNYSNFVTLSYPSIEALVHDQYPMRNAHIAYLHNYNASGSNFWGKQITISGENGNIFSFLGEHIVTTLSDGSIAFVTTSYSGFGSGNGTIVVVFVSSDGEMAFGLEIAPVNPVTPVNSEGQLPSFGLAVFSAPMNAAVVYGTVEEGSPLLSYISQENMTVWSISFRNLDVYEASFVEVLDIAASANGCTFVATGVSPYYNTVVRYDALNNSYWVKSLASNASSVISLVAIVSNSEECVSAGMGYSEPLESCDIVKFNCASSQIIWFSSIMADYIRCNDVALSSTGGYVVTGWVDATNGESPMMTFQLTENGLISDDDLPAGVFYVNATESAYFIDRTQHFQIVPQPVNLQQRQVSIENFNASVEKNFITYEEYCESNVSIWVQIAPIISIVAVALVALGFYDEKNRVDAPWKKVEPDAVTSKINETNEGVANHMNAVGLYANNPMMDSNSDRFYQIKKVSDSSLNLNP